MRNNIMELTARGDIFILSMDFSHAKPPERASLEDDNTLAAIAHLRHRGLDDLDVDAPRPLALFLSLMEKLGAKKMTTLERSNSSHYAPSADGTCTSYATVLFAN